MPKVGSQQFPYTSAGVRSAMMDAKNTGQKVNMMKRLKKGGSMKMKKK